VPSQAKKDPYTGLILLSGIDAPGIAGTLFSTLSAFVVSILDIEQMVIRDRLILTVLISLDRAHAGAIEADLNRCAADLGVDIAVSFAQHPQQALAMKPGLLRILALGNPLTIQAVNTLAGKLNEHKVNIERIHRIASSPVTAVEFLISGAQEAEIRILLAQISSEPGVDVAVLPRGELHWTKKLVLLDVDSTLIQQEVVDLLAAKAGVSERVVAITESAMRGEIDFEKSLRERVGLLEGLPIEVLDQVRSEILLTPGARTLVLTLQHLGHSVGVVSGGFIEVIEPILKELGIKYYRANTLGIESGKLTGTVLGPVIDRAAKASALQDFANQEGVPLKHTVAIGDGANDIDMIALAGLGVAFNAKPIVRAAADTALSQPNLVSVLYLMGISPEDIQDAESQSRQA
jgi:phosphoserine phosphatase